MAPKTLSQLAPTAGFSLKNDDISQRPGLAIWLSKCIAKWSAVEVALGAVTSALLGSAAVPTVAMYIELIAFNTKVQALDAAAERILIAEEYLILKALLKIIKIAVINRNKIAHQLWLFSEDVHDGLLLVDSKAIIPAVADAFVRALKGNAKKGYIPSEADISVAFDNILVFKECDFREMFLEFNEIEELLGMFTGICLAIMHLS